MRTVYLSEFKESIKSKIDNNEYKFINESVNVLCKNGLAYKVLTGQTIDSKGIKSEYSNKKDIPEKPTIDYVLEFELLPFVKNECKRMEYFKNQGKAYFY